MKNNDVGLVMGALLGISCNAAYGILVLYLSGASDSILLP